MNIIKHRTYTLEFDVWEATQKAAEVEIDALILAITKSMSHCGNVKLSIVNEERQR